MDKSWPQVQSFINAEWARSMASATCMLKVTETVRHKCGRSREVHTCSHTKEWKQERETSDGEEGGVMHSRTAGFRGSADPE